MRPRSLDEVAHPFWWLAVPAAVPVVLAAASLGLPKAAHLWLWSESGPVETSHVLVPMWALVLGVATVCREDRLRRARGTDLYWLAAGILALGLLCGVICGEEASWGQHYFGWATPEGWGKLNDQRETNLHNIGTWADQKPRALIELCVVLWGILWPVLSWLRAVDTRSALARFVPPKECVPIAVLGEGVRLLDRLPGSIGTAVHRVWLRPSELQELYFYLFFAFTLLAWRRRFLVGLAVHEVSQARRTPKRIDQPLRRAA